MRRFSNTSAGIPVTLVRKPRRDPFGFPPGGRPGLPDLSQEMIFERFPAGHERSEATAGSQNPVDDLIGFRLPADLQQRLGAEDPHGNPLIS